jgi:hypothetical protein
MKFIITFLLAICVHFALGQQGNEESENARKKIINYYHDGNVKEIKYQYKGEYVDSVFVFDKQGNVTQKGFFRENVLTLKDSLDNLKLIASYKGRTVHGYMKTFYASGHVRSISEYNMGKKNGIHLLFYDNGFLKTKECYKNGELNGIGVSYFKTGELKRKACFEMGKVEGELLEYYPNGKLKHKGDYSGSTPTGEHFYYNENGSLKEKKSFN